MTAKEMRACMVSFLLSNEQMSSIKDKGIKERPPFFCVGTHKRVRLRSGLPTYLGRLTLLYGDGSVWRCFPTHGWKELVKGGIEVHVTKGNHFMELFRNPELFILIDQYLHRYNQIHIKQLAEVNGSAI
jgi:hypothetical protein